MLQSSYLPCLSVSYWTTLAIMFDFLWSSKPRRQNDTLCSDGETCRVRQHHPRDLVGVRLGGQGGERRRAPHDDQGIYMFFKQLILGTWQSAVHTTSMSLNIVLWSRRGRRPCRTCRSTWGRTTPTTLQRSSRLPSSRETSRTSTGSARLSRRNRRSANKVRIITLLQVFLKDVPSVIKVSRTVLKNLANKIFLGGTHSSDNSSKICIWFIKV